MGKKNNTKGFIIGAAVGGFVGAVAALFLAPKSGEELRQDVAEKKDDLMEKTEEIREKGVEWISIAKEKTLQAKDVVAEKSLQVKDVVVEKSCDIKDTVVCTGQKVKEHFAKEAPIEAEEETPCCDDDCECKKEVADEENPMI